MNSGLTLTVELESGEVRELAMPASGEDLAALLAAHGLPLNTRCGSRGLCRGCEVELRRGTLDLGTRIALAPAVVKACQARLRGAAQIRLPARSQLGHRPQWVDCFVISTPYSVDPLFPPQPGGRDTGFAVDVGTTTVAVLLVDLASGRVLSRSGGFNAQVRFGDNVVTRLDAARTIEGRRALQRALVDETLKPLLEQACRAADRPASRLAGGTIAGNTLMLHLLAGEDPAGLATVPFKPQFLEARRWTAGQIGLELEELNREIPLQFLPGIAAYVGSDIAAGVYACGLSLDRGPGLLIDLGTNGEMVLHRGNELLGCATAAGPAFEGCGLASGAAAVEGAVTSLRLSLHPFHLDAGRMGSGPAVGICGSAYLDFLATGRRSGLLRENGRFDPGAWESIPPQHRLMDEGVRAVRLQGGMRITERDVAALLQAKAAIGAGILTLLDKAGIAAPGLDRVYLAGGFGRHLDVRHALEIGLLPGIRREQVQVVGNTALAGALLALVDRASIPEMRGLAAKVKVLELDAGSGFENRFFDQLRLP
ncbi:MAG: ASKHA domain-containing protein [Verrucomicrobiota bacterium]